MSTENDQLNIAHVKERRHNFTSENVCHANTRMICLNFAKGCVGLKFLYNYALL